MPWLPGAEPVRTVQCRGVCENCLQRWECAVPVDRTPRVYCTCGCRHVVEFVFHSIAFVLNDVPHHALPSVN